MLYPHYILMPSVFFHVVIYWSILEVALFSFKINIKKNFIALIFQYFFIFLFQKNLSKLYIIKFLRVMRFAFGQ